MILGFLKVTLPGRTLFQAILLERLFQPRNNSFAVGATDKTGAFWDMISNLASGYGK